MQAFQYQQDFEEERAAREQTFGTNDALSDQLRKYMAEAETEKREKQAVIAKLQDARQRLEVSLADSAKLHDEVMAKTAQVKQYKKQTDSFKAKVEEANTKLLKTQQELQRRLELIKTMEEDNQYQVNLLLHHIYTVHVSVRNFSLLSRS